METEKTMTRLVFAFAGWRNRGRVKRKTHIPRRPDPSPLLVHRFLLFVLGILIPSMILAQTQPTSKVPSIVEQLVIALDGALDAGARGVSGFSNGVLHVSPDGKIELLFHATGPTGPTEEASLQAVGATIVTSLVLPPGLNLPPVGMVQAWVPYAQVHAAATLPWVVAVTPPDYGFVDSHPTNRIDSEGVALHRADQAHADGITGAGVIVGVISDGVTNLADAQAAHELPAVAVIAGGLAQTTPAGAGDEGTALLEIVHDMAPDASLMFHASGAGVIDHVNALGALFVAGAHVIAEDFVFDEQPIFQQGLAAVTAERIAAAGTSVHSSAGNRGLNHAAQVLAVGTGGGPEGSAGPFAGCTFTPDNVVAIAPGGDTTFDVILGIVTMITLQWSEPRAIFPTAGQGGFTDLNLYVMDAALTTCLAESVSVQADGVGDTLERIVISAPETHAKIVVDVQGTSTAVTPPRLDLRWRGAQAQIDRPTRAGSLNPDSNYTALATSAGAVNATTGELEPYSAGGPVILLTTTRCPEGGLGPCVGVPGPPAVIAGAPHWATADDIAISGVGGFGRGTCPAVNPGDCRLLGTSASAPHAAACDALVRQALENPAASVGLVKAILASTAIDIPPYRFDNASGFGQLDCFRAVSRVKTLREAALERGESISLEPISTGLRLMPF
jgi:subtilase family protein